MHERPHPTLLNYPDSDSHPSLYMLPNRSRRYLLVYGSAQLYSSTLFWFTRHGQGLKFWGQRINNLTKKVEHEKVQYDRAYDKVCKCPAAKHKHETRWGGNICIIPFGRYVFEQLSVFHVDLRAQRRREHELTDRARKTIPGPHYEFHNNGDHVTTITHPARKALKGKLVTRTQYTNWMTPDKTRKTRKASTNFKRAGVVSR
jgi:hypothetical protein